MINEGSIPAVHIGSRPYSVSVNIDWPPWLVKGTEGPCIGKAPLFFPPSYAKKFKPRIDDAKALCAACPLVKECWDWATERPDLDGIWAGTTPMERRAVRVLRSQGMTVTFEGTAA